MHQAKMPLDNQLYFLSHFNDTPTYNAMLTASGQTYSSSTTTKTILKHETSYSVTVSINIHT